MTTAVQDISDIPKLVRHLEQRSRAALARLLSLAATDNKSAALSAALSSIPKRPAPVIALTGSGGVGKSSLLGVLAKHFCDRGERIGILACDPESPITGGALLGDRCRIADAAASEQIFIRSVATAAGRQGIAQNLELMLDVIKGFGFDRIFIETVGAGQGDTAVRFVADVVVLVLQPQTGDELQWEKAGILEIADIIAVNKCDLPGAEQTIADVTQQMQSAAARSVPVVKVSVAKDEGLEGLFQVVEAATASRNATGNTKA